MKMVAPFPALLLILTSALAAEPEVIVEVDRQRLYEGESVRYSVTLNNVENPTAPRLEGFADFDVASLGEQSLNSSSITIINGRMTQVVRHGRRYDYRLTPRKSGPLTVPAPTAEVEGKVIRGRQVKLTVVPPTEQDVAILKVTSDRAAVYPMQPFTVRLTILVKELPALFSDRDPLTVQPTPPTLSIPWADDGQLPEALQPAQSWQKWLGPLQDRRGNGFSINDIGQDSVFAIFERRAAAFLPTPKRIRQADSTGKERGYWQYAFERTFVAKRVGEFAFGPVTLKGTFATSMAANKRLSGEDIYTVTKGASVVVKPVPEEGRPESFSGAVGKFTIEADLNPRQVKVGDPITLTLTLRGEGTLEDARAPDLTAIPEVTEHFKTYEPTIETQDSARRFTYSLRPKQAGIKAFPAIPLSYFDFEEERYVTLKTTPIPLEVSEATALASDQIVTAGAGSQANGPNIQVQAEGVFANITDLSAIRDETVRPLRWCLGLAGLAVLYIAVVSLTQYLQRRAGDAALLRRLGAAARARSALDRARLAIEANELKQGAEAIRTSFVGLVADAANTQEAGLTPRDVQEQLDRWEIPAETAQPVVQLLHDCDGARYGASEATVRELGDRSRAVLGALLDALKEQRRLR